MINWEKEKLNRNIVIKFSEKTFVLDFFDIEDRIEPFYLSVQNFLNKK